MLQWDYFWHMLQCHIWISNWVLDSDTVKTCAVRLDWEPPLSNEFLKGFPVFALVKKVIWFIQTKPFWGFGKVKYPFAIPKGFRKFPIVFLLKWAYFSFNNLLILGPLTWLNSRYIAGPLHPSLLWEMLIQARYWAACSLVLYLCNN